MTMAKAQEEAAKLKEVVDLTQPKEEPQERKPRKFEGKDFKDKKDFNDFKDKKEFKDRKEFKDKKDYKDKGFTRKTDDKPKEVEKKEVEKKEFKKSEKPKMKNETKQEEKKAKEKKEPVAFQPADLSKNEWGDANLEDILS
uniref:Uncharacterized protein n=1 Tax=Euplotes harpa TaxID=151035 RepID=A0A7S3NA80_9SPIT|mmetsp:Transcript_29042/g.33184  ORF Transcript_29042/g.33184 Transcript_29042/m.33184 type:complete len:141 (+) Transcript_29042:859-1281(+)